MSAPFFIWLTIGLCMLAVAAVGYVARLTRALSLPPAPRSARLSDEELVEHARDLAVQIRLQGIRPAAPAAGVTRQLQQCHAKLAQAAVRGEELVPASRWVIDHAPRLLESAAALQERLVRVPMLPAPSKGIYAGLPRIYALAAELCAHTDAHVCRENIDRFLRAYQATAPLRLAELWAMPLMLQHALLLQAVAVAQDCVRAQDQRRTADAFADALQAGSALYPGEPKGFGAAFVERLAARLREEAAPSDAMGWLQDRLRERDVQLDLVIASEHRRQARNQAVIGNAVTSLRLLTQLNWTEVCEALSPVDAELRADPAGVYPRMDLPSRDLYRRAVTRMSVASGKPESFVAHAALQLSRDHEADDRRAHVGWYLLSGGEGALIETIGRVWLPMRVARFFRAHAQTLYVLGAWALSTGLSLLGAYVLRAQFFWPYAAFLLTVPAQTAAQIWLIRIVRRLCPPRILPRLAPGDMTGKNALLVVPTLITSPEKAAALARSLETHYLSNRLPELSFALLTDFADADAASLPGDAAVLAAAQEQIDALNCRWGKRFYLLHRPRMWNATQRRFMGWERKRGALLELNRFLLGGVSGFVDADSALVGVTHVITLDQDTMLPPGAAAQLLGVALHPLNRVGEVEGRRVGTAVFAPRAGTPLSHISTRLQKMMGGPAGVDYYASAVSDVYQDLCGQGIFCGKGVYDVRAFHDATSSALPLNAILSHDLIEGLLSGAALVSDVVLFDAPPQTLHSFAMRLHRWTRGDWQLLPFLLPYAKDAHGRPRRTGFSLLAGYKIFDNLRRSLAPAAFVLCALAAAWLRLPGLLYIAFVLTFFDWVFLVFAVFQPARYRDIGRQLAQTLQRLALSPLEAALGVDAAVRSLVRVLFTRRHLLDWVTAADADRTARRSYLRRCAAGPALGVAMLLSPFFGFGPSTPALDLCALLLGALWALLPAFAAYLSRPLPPAARPDAADEPFLRGAALRTWRFFEQSVTDAEHGLPPDNVQTMPNKGPARRTSPTNIGLYLASCAAAHALGFISATELARRCGQTLQALEGLPKWRGHTLNWVSTADLTALAPRYVSAVDSGNLAACLWTLSQALRAVSGEDAELLRRGVEARLRVAAEEGFDAEGPLHALLSDAPDKGLRACAAALADAPLPLAAEGGAAAASAVRALAMPVARQELLRLAERADALADAMDFAALYDPHRRLFAIGFDMEADALSDAHYDLLASESRLLSFVAIAKGDVPAEHFSRLGRPVGMTGRGAVLLSWGGTMFEYLMPPLLLTERPGSLLHQTAVNAVWAQRARDAKAPWGVSESGYCAFDLQLNYQYRAFGVTSLALRGGTEEDMVVAPYASALALCVQPSAAAGNMRLMAQMGWLTPEGFIEAADYAPARTEGERYRLVRSGMAHHQGMTLLSLCNALTDGLMRALFLADPRVLAHDLLLQERAGLPPRLPERRALQLSEAPLRRPPRMQRRCVDGHSPLPDTHLLAGGGTMLVCTAAGLCFAGRDGTRWNRYGSDPSDTRYGICFYLRDPDTDEVWGAHPRGGGSAQESACVFSPDRAVYTRLCGGIHSTLTAFVSPENGAVLVTLELVNRSERTRTIEATSFFEATLSPHDADVAHQAFRNLFIEAQPVPDGVLLSRRPREQGGATERLLHVCLAADGAPPPDFTAGRAAFLHRGQDARHPLGLHEALPGEAGGVLDPCAALRRVVSLPSGGRAELTFALCSAASPEEARAFCDSLRGDGVRRALDLAGTYAQVETTYLGLTRPQFKTWHRAAACALFAGLPPGSRAPYLPACRGTAADLWRFGLSGDLPIVAVRLNDVSQLALLRQALQMHALWRLKGLQADLLVLNESGGDYLRPLHTRILEEVEHSGARERVARPGGVYLVDGHALSDESRAFLLGVSCLLLQGEGDIAKELALIGRADPGQAAGIRPRPALAPSALPIARLASDNGVGGFDATAYVVRLHDGRGAPAPWCNVLANERFGALVSDRGTGYTWAENAREAQITPFTNDPVSDPYAECLYLRDEAGAAWSPLPGPASPPGETRCRHDIGATYFYSAAGGLLGAVSVHVDAALPVKCYLLTLDNPSPRERRLTAFFAARLRMGCAVDDCFTASAPSEDGAYVYGRALRGGMPGVSLAWAPGRQAVLGGDLRPFFGEGGPENPDALGEAQWSGSFSGSLPGLILAAEVSVPAGGQAQVAFALGWVQDEASAPALLRAFQPQRSLKGALKAWSARLSAFTLPDKSPEAQLACRWLPYQTWACRMWGRTGFYQAGGAFGFRDQLQDCLLIVHYDPALVRAHLLRCAAHQFEEGDVQHWWHEPRRGVRTRISDDMLFLPYVLCDYVQVTGDRTILSEVVPYLSAPPLPDGREDDYGSPGVSQQQESLLGHARRAISRACRFGAHGLPLMGTGDWNDAMNRVGAQGRGESVWLAWLLITVLQQFAALLRQEEQASEAAMLEGTAREVLAAVEEHGWDGMWYRRAFDDDGQPLGSLSGRECRIDLIAQSWAVICGAGDRGRAQQALDCAMEELLDEQSGVLRLLWPPFNGAQYQPGYIQGYLPGVRENGGQYTHAAAWAVMALAMEGDMERAWALFRLLLPTSRTDSPEGVFAYKTEPYVMAADVYSCAPHAGRGGWTWYTGSAAWMARVYREHLLGLTVRGGRVRLAPRWTPSGEAHADIRREKTTLCLHAFCGPGPLRVTLDGAPVAGEDVAMPTDGRTHEAVFDRRPVAQ